MDAPLGFEEVQVLGIRIEFVIVSLGTFPHSIRMSLQKSFNVQ